MQDGLKRRACHVLHAQEMQVEGFVDGLAKDSNNVRMFEFGQRLRFASPIQRHLEGDLPPKRQLTGQIDPRKSAASQFTHQFEIVETLTFAWIACKRCGARTR